MTATRRVPVILFLIADTGGGHRSAANAIRAAMDLINTESTTNSNKPLVTFNANELTFSTQDYIPSSWGKSARPWRAEIHDIFQECGLLPLRRTAKLYGPTVEKTPSVYAGFYYVTNIKPAYAALSVFTQTMLTRGLLELVDVMQPDVIVSVHPLLTHSTLNLIRHTGVTIPFITVVTDLVRFHRAWAEPEVDVCSAPTEAARELLIELGMPAEKIRLLGMPIHPKFCLPPADRTALITEMKMDPARFTVLVVGGGDGVGGLGETTLALANSGLPIQMMVVTGRNRSLFQELSQMTLPIPTKILGFVQNMPDLMRSADVIVTKAGPGTIMEALSCGLPIILTGAIPGQEEGNIVFVEENHVGELARTPDAVVDAVERLTRLGADEMAEIRRRASKLSNPRASFDIARLIFSYLPSPRSISQWNQPTSNYRWRSSLGRLRRPLQPRYILWNSGTKRRSSTLKAKRTLPFLSRRTSTVRRRATHH